MHRPSMEAGCWEFEAGHKDWLLQISFRDPSSKCISDNYLFNETQLIKYYILDDPALVKKDVSMCACAYNTY